MGSEGSGSAKPRGSSENRELLERLFDNIHILIAHLDPEFNFIRVNRAYAEADGRAPDFFIGKNHFELYPHEENERIFRQVAESGEPYVVREKPFEYPDHPDWGPTYWDWSLTPIKDARGRVESLVLTLAEVTGRKRAQLALEEREQYLRRLNRAYAVLHRCNDVLVHAESESGMLVAFCRAVVREGGYRFAWIGQTEENETRSVRPLAWAGHEAGYLSQARITWSGEDESGQGPVGCAARARRPCVIRNVETDERFRPWRSLALSRGYRSMIALPLLDAEGAFAVLSIYAAEADAFDTEETGLLAELASDLAFGIRTLRERAALREAESQLRLRSRAVEAVNDAVALLDATDPDRRVVYVNNAFEHVTGYAGEDVTGRPPDFLFAAVDRTGMETLRHGMRLLVSVRTTLHNRRADDSPYWAEVRLDPVRDEAGVVDHLVVAMRDITDLMDYQSQLEHQANYDTLTGLPNRNLLRDRLSQAIGYAHRERRAVAVLFLDLDRFKIVNDSLGHAVGDALLREVAARLGSEVREGDTVARQGGDEFVLVLPSPGDGSAIAGAVRRFTRQLEDPIEVLGHSLHVTASVGVALYPTHGEDVETLLRSADTAMYRAKELGGGEFVFFSEDLNTRAHERLRTDEGLRRALEEGELHLHYQPQVDLEDDSVVAVEALLRWDDPEAGPISPARFIPLAEETGLIVPLGRWVLQAACARAADRARRRAPLPVAVNLSPRQLQYPNLERDVASALEESGLDPSLLELELTESALMAYPEAARTRLKRLKAMGIRLALDDFGTGYSSLAQLSRFPFDRLKIDHRFVQGLPDDATNASIVLAILSLARALGMKVVAEGVEREAELAWLRDHGCDAVQGFLVGRPVPPEELRL